MTATDARIMAALQLQPMTCEAVSKALSIAPGTAFTRMELLWLEGLLLRERIKRATTGRWTWLYQLAEKSGRAA